MAKQKEFLSVAEAAAMLDIDERHVRRLVTSNPAWRVKVSERVQVIPRSAIAEMRARPQKPGPVPKNSD